MPKTNYKSETIRINLSTPFIVRSRCKFCGEFPSVYYLVRNSVMWHNPRKIQEQSSLYNSIVERLCANYYLKEDPKSFTSTNYFAYWVPYKNYRPRLHRTRGSNPVLDTIEFFTCDCGRTTWALSEKAVKNRPEISNRKARRKYPNKFEY